MTIIKIEAGKEHIIKVGTKEYRFTIKPREVRYFMGLREAGVPVVQIRAFMEWLSAKTVITLADVLEITDAFIGLRTLAFQAKLTDVLSTTDKFLNL